MNAVITIDGLRKSYGQREAVRGIDLEVHAGEIFAFLGPNGAGKTTTVEILEGYRDPTAGQVWVLGADPARADRDWRSRIGVMLQSWQVEPALTVRESLEQFAGYYPRPLPVEEVVRLVGLEEQRDTRAGRLSGGQQRRLDMGIALVGDPELLFLDEPTTGFDPAARRGAWQIIASLRDAGKTVMLTTHYLDEAQALADRVAILVDGRIMTHGPPDSLVAGHPTRITFQLPHGVALPPLPLPGRLDAEAADGRVELRSHAPVPLVHALTAWAMENGHDLADLQVRRPSLEDVYLDLTSTPRAQS
ncbi:ABC-2 type transport system ATP-binding protein [Kribbella sp. VKM Ac-2527]|uniref:ABC-2 type transport system ATP-binding protein n=1 Tax=Kribbella caucasensis TaxID=2512215 RepID=A0A4R6KAA3_9ACTN|nr:ABC transporter ATP-binding protein [Kribbella sp. VKM Ac-2527]TDO46730.1 ABC-2 type transport system ATP-binding protein [Kribbella sp. VKM Ac-2527]